MGRMGLDTTEDDEDRAAIAALWVSASERVLARITLIEDALGRLAADGADEEALQEATGESHKLAGSLGTFGVAEGSRIAKELELLLLDDGDIGEAARLCGELRAAVDAGPAA